VNVVQKATRNFGSSFTCQKASFKAFSAALVVQNKSVANMSGTVIIYHLYKRLSSLFTVGTFYIISLVANPQEVERTGIHYTELRCDWHDEADLDGDKYYCKFYVREPDNITIHGPYEGVVTKEGSKEYHATFNLDIVDTWPLGFWDLQVEVFK